MLSAREAPQRSSEPAGALAGFLAGCPTLSPALAKGGVVASRVEPSKAALAIEAALGFSFAAHRAAMKAQNQRQGKIKIPTSAKGRQKWGTKQSTASPLTQSPRRSEGFQIMRRGRLHPNKDRLPETPTTRGINSVQPWPAPPCLHSWHTCGGSVRYGRRCRAPSASR